MLRPALGFGVDAHVHFGAGLNCFASAEACLNGHSQVAFGIEPRAAPWLRLQLAPALQIILHFPIMRLSRLKRLHAGAVAAVARYGRFANFDATSRRTLTDSIRTVLEPSIEMHHRSTVNDAFFDPSQRRDLRQPLEEIRAMRDEWRAKLRTDRLGTGHAFDPRKVPELDPRLIPVPHHRIPQMPDGPRSGLPRSMLPK